ncbi:hypothetical protein ABK040_009293 [Willaertia magna]
MLTLELKESITQLLQKYNFLLEKFVGYEPTGHFLIVCNQITKEGNDVNNDSKLNHKRSTSTSSSTSLPPSENSSSPSFNNRNTETQSIVHVDFLSRKVNLLCKLPTNLDCFSASLNFNHSILSITTTRVLYKTNSGVISPSNGTPTTPTTPVNNSSPHMFHTTSCRYNESFQIISNLNNFLQDDTLSSTTSTPTSPYTLSPIPPSPNSTATMNNGGNMNERILLYETYLIELKAKKSKQTFFYKSQHPQIFQFIHSNRLKNGKNYFLFLTYSTVQIYAFTMDLKTGGIIKSPKLIKTLTNYNAVQNNSNSNSSSGSNPFTSFISSLSDKSKENKENTLNIPSEEMIWYQWDVDTHLLYYIIVNNDNTIMNNNGNNNNSKLMLHCWKIDLEELQLIYKLPIINHLPNINNIYHFSSYKVNPLSPFSPIYTYSQHLFQSHVILPNNFNFQMENSTIKIQVINLENGNDILCIQCKEKVINTNISTSLDEQQLDIVKVNIYHFKEKKCFKTNLFSKHFLFIGKYKKRNLLLFLPNKYLQIINGVSLSTICQFNGTLYGITLHNEFPILLDEPHQLSPVFNHVEGHFINLKNGCVFHFDLLISYLTNSHWLQIPDLVNQQFIPVLEFILMYYPKDFALNFLNYLFYSMNKSAQKRNIQFTKLISLGMKEYIIGAVIQRAQQYINSLNNNNNGNILSNNENDFLFLLPRNRYGFYESILGLTSNIIKKTQIKTFALSVNQNTLNYEEFLRRAILQFSKTNKTALAKKWSQEIYNILLDEVEILFQSILQLLPSSSVSSEDNAIDLVESNANFFKVLQCFYTCLFLDYRLPIPNQFNYHFVISGFKYLNRDLFYQYCEKGLFEVNNQIILSLIENELLIFDNEQDIICLNYLLNISIDSNLLFKLSQLEQIEMCQSIIINYYHSIYCMLCSDSLDSNENIQHSLKKILKKRQRKPTEKSPTPPNTTNNNNANPEYLREQLLNILSTNNYGVSNTNNRSSANLSINGSINGSNANNDGSIIQQQTLSINGTPIVEVRSPELLNYYVDFDTSEESAITDYSDTMSTTTSNLYNTYTSTFTPLVSFLLSMHRFNANNSSNNATSSSMNIGGNNNSLMVPIGINGGNSPKGESGISPVVFSSMPNSLPTSSSGQLQQSKKFITFSSVNEEEGELASMLGLMPNSNTPGVGSNNNGSFNSSGIFPHFGTSHSLIRERDFIQSVANDHYLKKNFN